MNKDIYFQDFYFDDVANIYFDGLANVKKRY